MPPESTAGIQQSQMRLARTSSEVELPPPSARAEWVASLQRRLSPGQSPRSSSSSSSAPLSDGVEGGAGSRPAPMTVESFVSKYGGGGGEAVDAAAEREGSGAGPAAATATAGADTSLPLAAATAVVAAADGTSGGGGGIDSAATAAAFRRYIHMMAQLPSAAPGSTGAGSTGAVRVRAAPRSLWAGTGLWVADSSADTPPSRAGAAAPSRKQHSGPTAAPGSAPAPSSAVAAPPFGLRALPKQQLYYRPLTDAATVTLVLEREPVAAGSGRRTADALPQQLLPQQPRRQIANSAGPVPGTTPRDSESAHEAATAAGMAAAAAPPSRQPPRTLPSRMRSRWDVSGEPLRPPPAAAPVSCWERLSSSTGRGGACKSADAAIRPGRSGALAKQPPAVSNAVMQGELCAGQGHRLS